MFGIGYYNNDDPQKTVVNLKIDRHNFESAKTEVKNIAKHPSFTHKTLGVIDYSQGRFYPVN